MLACYTIGNGIDQARLGYVTPLVARSAVIGCRQACLGLYLGGTAVKRKAPPGLAIISYN